MWGYESGANIYGVKVVFVKKLILVLNGYMAFHGVWCKSPKLILSGLRFCDAKHKNSSWIEICLLLLLLFKISKVIYNTKHHKIIISGVKHHNKLLTVITI